MEKIRFITKGLFSLLIVWSLFSVCLAKTTQEWRDIFDQLRDDLRTDAEIKQVMNDLWYNANEYLWKTSNSKTTTSNWTTQLWRDILNKYKQNWWSDDEIKQALEDAWLDTSGYFPENNATNYSNSILSYTYSSSTYPPYTSRSCKMYRIEYIELLNAYTSPDLLKKEYFVNTDYLKRYIDSKNKKNTECNTDWWWISASYPDNNTSDRYIAPNGKIYFIATENWSYTSNELNTYKTFQTVDELRNYIKKRNPLISM